MSSQKFINALRIKWKDYLNTNVQLSDEKNVKLDGFLASFLHLSEKHKFKKCPEFDDLTSCGNILTRQFLSDVHRLCTECWLENEDVTPLIHYLLEGRGWKILWLIKLVGIETLPCNNDLAKVLLSFFPLSKQFYLYSLNQTHNSSNSHYQSYFDKSHQDCFYIFNGKNCPQSSLPKKKDYRRKCANYRTISINSPKIFIYSSSENEYFKESKALEKTVKLEVSNNTKPWNYFSLPNVKSSEEIEIEEKVEEKIPEVNIEKVELKSLSFVQFCDCVIELLVKISLQDGHVQNKYNLISPIILTSSLNMFETICADSTLTDWSSEDAYRVKEQLLSLIFTSSDVLATSNEGRTHLEKEKVTEKLLSLAARNEGYSDEEKEYLKTKIVNGEFNFLSFNVVSGCLYLSCIMSTRCLESKCYEQLSNVAYFLPCQKAVIATSIVEFEERDKSKVENVINRVTEIISKIKKRRAAAWHSKDCNKKIHKRCDFLTNDHHHYDNFGSNEYENKCSVANYLQVLLDIYEKSRNSSTHHFILSQLKKVGFCCCLKADLIVSNFLNHLQSQSVILRETVFNFIERYVLYQLIPNDDFGSTCEFCAEESTSNEQTNGSRMRESSQMYKKLLTSCEDSHLLHQLEKHILQLCLSGKKIINRDLFLKVISPIFFKNPESEEKIINDKFLTEHLTLFCLRSFTHLLEDEVLADIFMEKGGLKVLKAQLKHGDYGPLILRTFNVLITTETNKPNGSTDFPQLISVLALEEIIADQCAKLSLSFDEKGDHLLNLALIQKRLEYQNDIWSTSLLLMKKCKCYVDHVQNGNTCAIAYSALSYLFSTTTTHFFSAMKNEEELLDGKFLKTIFNTLGILLSVCLNVSPFLITEKNSKQVINEIKLVEETEVFLRLCIEWPSEIIALLMETLLNTAQGSFFNRKLISSEISANLVLCEEADISEVELDLSLNSDIPIIDQGYDADEDSSDLVNYPRTCTTLDESNITYPSIIGIILNFLKNFVVLVCDDDDENIRVLTIVVHRLLTLGRKNAYNALCLYQQGIIEIIFQHFKKFFRQNSLLKDFQTSLLDLFIVVAKQSISSEEFSLFIDLFKLPEPPLDVLLMALQKQISFFDLGPRMYLKFPIQTEIIPLVENTSRQENPIEDNLQSDHFGSNHSLNFVEVKAIQSQHLKRGLNSSWSKAACFLPIHHKTKCSFSSNFSACLWLKTNTNNKQSFSKVLYKSNHFGKNSKHFGDSFDTSGVVTTSVSENGEILNSLIETNEAQHVISIGHNHMMFEVWLLMTYESLILRVSTYDNGKYTILSETFCRSALKMKVWHLVTVNYTSLQDDDKVFGKITIIVDSYITNDTLKFELKTNRSYIFSPMNCVLIGHSSESYHSNDEDSWCLGSFALLNDVVLSRDFNLALYILGANNINYLASFTDRDGICFPSQLIAKLINSGVKLSVINQALKADLSSLKEIVALIYTPNKFESVLQLWNETGVTANVKLEKNCKSVPIQHSTNLIMQRSNVINCAIDQLGGVSLMLLLACRVVECSSDEEIKAKGLSLLLNFVGKSYSYRREFLDLNGPSLVAKLVSTSRFEARYVTLKTVVNCCLSSPIIKCTSVLAKATIIEKSQAVILDSEVLIACFSQWKTWEKYDSNVYKTFLLAIKELISEEHPHQMFNRSHLSHNFINNLLMSFKERYFEDKLVLPHDICHLMILIMEKLVAFPLELSVLKSIYNFVLLAHPAANTNLFDDCHNFYFSLHPSARFRPISVATTVSTSVGNYKEQNSSENEHSELMSEQEDFCLNLPDLPTSSDEKCLQNAQSIDSELSQMTSGKIRSIKPYTKFCDSPMYYKDYEIIDVFQTIYSLDKVSTSENQSDDWEVFTVDGSEKNCKVSHDEPNSMIILCSGLLELLVETIEWSSDISTFVKLEHLLILANNTDNLIRTAVIKLLRAALKQVSNTEKTSFFDKKGFVMLANQIRKHSSSTELVEATMSLLLDRKVTFDDCNECQVKSLNFEQKESLVLLMALLPTTTNNTTLCHKLLTFMHELSSLQANNMILHFTNEAYLEVIIQVIMNIMTSESSSAAFDCEDQHVLLIDIKMILDEIAEHSISGPHYKTLTDLLILLSFAEKQEKKRQDSNIRLINGLRFFQCSCLHRAIEFMHNQYKRLLNNPVKGIFYQNNKWIQFRKIIVWSTDFLVHKDDVDNTSRFEKHFIRDFIQSHIEAIKKQPSKKHDKSGMTTYHASTCSALLRLLIFLLSPLQTIEQRLFVVNVIIKEDCPDTLLHILLKNNSKELRQRFWYYLGKLLTVEDELITSLVVKDCKYLLGYIEHYYRISTVTEEVKEKWCSQDKSERKHWLWLNENEEDKILTKHDRLVRTVGDHAKKVTVSMLITQDSLRRDFLNNIKTAHHEIFYVRDIWGQLIARLCHERAVWHFDDCYPDTWELCNIEGPCRERKRLQRSHLHLDARFLLPTHKHKLEPATKNKPFSFLFEDDDLSFGCLAADNRIYADDRIRYSSACVMITPSHDVEGDILVGSICLYFLGEQVECKSINTQKEGRFSYEWDFKHFREVVQRRYCLEDTAIEIFLVNGETYFLNFKSEKDRDALYQNIMNNYLPNLSKPLDLARVTEFWRSGCMTNFEYLTLLNKFAGRSHNDLMQYPVFPFVLSNYESETLNLLDQANYRDFQRPVAIQDKRREKHYADTYQYWKNERQKQDAINDSYLMPVLGPFHYGSHYSNSMTVLYFLVRLPPYTGIFIKYQDSNFDIPDRSFHSLNVAWRLSSSESSTDMKELIPEMFYLPDLFINSEGFDMGVRQNGEKVDHVVLPSWAQNNSRLFVLIHRQALESEYVKDHLNEWIDLIFGYKQTGKAAVEGINVYYPTTYYGFQKDHITDPIQLAAIKTMIRTLGQTPKQLFNSPHPFVTRSLTGADNQPSNNSQIPAVVKNIQGLQWGNYVGSPACSKYSLLWTNQENQIVSFVPLNNNDVLGLAENCCALYNAFKSKVPTVNAIISWKYDDGTIRIRTEPDQKPYWLLRKSIIDEVTCCTTALDSPFFYVGHESGIVMSYAITFQASKAVIPNQRPVCVYGHHAAVTSLTICPSFGIMISASLDRTCILWDLISLNYIRTIKIQMEPKLVSISKTSGDIAVVCNSVEVINDLRLYTINCNFVGEVSVSTVIHSICFSCAPEGSSVNVIATGMENGEIHLWSTWDLRPVHIIKQDKFIHPIISLCYSADSQTLFAANSIGEVIAWINGNKKLNKPAGYKQYNK